MSERIKLLRMTNKLEYLLTTIRNGFELRTHPVKFNFNPKTGIEYQVPMICFAELRDVLKISEDHTGKYGRYGFCMKLDWALAQGADRVLYVAPEREFSKRLAVVIEMLQTLPKNGRRLYDLMAFVQPAKDQEDFEWRIVRPEGLDHDPVPFALDDVELIYVSHEKERDIVHRALEDKARRDRYDGKFPEVCLTEALEVA